MRNAGAVLLALLLAACTKRLEGRTAGDWAAEMNDAEKGNAAYERLKDHGVESLDILVEIERTGPVKTRIQAAALLGRLGPDAAPAVPALVEALASKDKGLRGMAAIALGRIGEAARDAIVPLDRALRDPDVRVRVAAALAIYGITGESAAPTRVLFETLAHHDPDVRAMVAEAFEQLGTPIVGFLVLSLENEDETTRVRAAKTLGAMGPAAEEARAALLKALDDKSEAVREAAGDALGKLGEKQR